MVTIKDCSACLEPGGSFLNECSKDIMEKIVQKRDIRYYKKKEVIFEQGQKINGIFCIYSGKVKNVKRSQKQKDYIISLAKPGDFLGLHSVIHDLEHTTSAVTLENTVGCFIPKKVFLDIIRSDTAIFLKVMKLLCSDIDKVEKRISEFSHKSISKRLANGLLLLKDTFGLDDNNRINISLKSVELPSLIIASETDTNQTLDDFVDNNLINLQQKKIQLNNIESIKAIASQNNR